MNYYFAVMSNNLASDKMCQRNGQLQIARADMAKQPDKRVIYDKI